SGLDPLARRGARAVGQRRRALDDQRLPAPRIGDGAAHAFVAPPQAFEPPGPERLQIYLRRNVVISPDRRRAVMTASMRHPDAEFARYVIQRVVQESDNFLRQKSLARSADYIDYLENRLKEVQIAEHRSALTQALSSYEMMRMMASSTVPFTAEPFGQVVTSLEPVSPRPNVVIGIGIFLGLVAFGAYVFLMEWVLRRHPRPALSPETTLT
ncbi:MAG: hypothetical protein ACK4TG_07215, partial [Thermaurantiacus sp.]